MFCLEDFEGWSKFRLSSVLVVVEVVVGVGERRGGGKPRGGRSRPLPTSGGTALYLAAQH